MKLTVVIEKLYHYLQDFGDQYTDTASLIAISPDVRDNTVNIYIAGQFYDFLAEWQFDDNVELIDKAAGTIRAAMLIKRLIRNGQMKTAG